MLDIYIYCYNLTFIRGKAIWLKDTKWNIASVFYNIVSFYFVFENFVGRRLFYVIREVKPYIWTSAYEASRDGFGMYMSNMYVRTMSGLVRVYGVVGNEYLQ